MKNTVVFLFCCIAGWTLSEPALAKSTIGGVVFLNAYGVDDDNGAENNRATVIKLANNSRLRVRWANEDNVGLYMEMGVGAEVKLRHAYGTWKINDSWQVLAGQTSTPFAPLNPSVAMIHNSGQAVGSVSPGRQSQVRLTYKLLNRRGAFAIALLDPNGGSILDEPEVESELGRKSADYPRVDIGGAYKAFNWQVFPSAFYQTQAYSDVDQGYVDEVDSWGVSLGLKSGFGAWVVSFEYGVGENWGNTRMSQSGSPAGDNASALTHFRDGLPVLANNSNENYWIDAGYRFTYKEVKGVIHFIAGQSTSELPDLSNYYESSMIGVSIPMDLPWIARGVRIRPEIFVFDYSNVDVADETYVNQGIRTMAGVQLQYSF